jgi:glycosyltransferase involved in cell wall biosynthesis
LASIVRPVAPHVACILPTRNRYRFVRQALAYFLAQDYADRSLIVLDNGVDATEALIPEDARIRYIRLPAALSRGAKRNYGCQLAPEDALIAHWDDDDWMAPDRLTQQVTALMEAGADLCAAAGVLHYSPRTDGAWRDKCGLCAGTFVYRRQTWESAPLADRTGGEERALLQSLTPERIARIESPSFYVALLHDGNTIGRNVADAQRWERVSVRSVAPLLAAETAFCASLRREPQPPAALPRRPQSPESQRLSSAPEVRRAVRSGAISPVTVVAPFLIYDGYGSMAEYLVLGLEKAGARVHTRPLNLDLNGLSPDLCRILQTSQAIRPDRDAPVLYFCWPRPDINVFSKSSELFVNTMWEGTYLPSGWADALEQAQALVVPSTFVADVCRRSGVTRPVFVVPEGVDPEVYTYQERPERPGVTTLIVGTLVSRKNVVEGIAAWKQAFGDDPEARLILKARFQYRNYVPDDPRIRFVDENEPTRGIVPWYREADVLLALGSEGFGLPLVEGMATGLPVIALNAAGQADTCRAAGQDCVLTVPAADWVAHEQAPFGPGGLRPVPDVAAVVAHLRWVKTHRAEARAMGRAASDWARRERSIWNKAPAVLDLMEMQRGRGTAPLRRVPTLWTPSKGSTCGVAEYTAHLTKGLGAHVRHTANAPDLCAATVVHVQHESSLFEDATLLAKVRQARCEGVPVVVTEHTVTEMRRPWEAEASALVALTSRGASTLRARLPGQQVAYIPPGCPDWFPPRKAKRGRVIAGFGFLEPYKGFGQLLDVVRTQARSHPETELLLFSHAKTPEREAEWEKAASGLPVRRIREYLPIEEVARRLAAEADILVFWYDEYPLYAASYAVRIALATGVPVLASPTNWFHDLTEVTYQPEDLTTGIERLLTDEDLRDRLTTTAREYCCQHRWSVIAARHRALWERLPR